MATHENAHEAVHALDEALHSTGACSDYLGPRRDLSEVGIDLIERDGNTAVIDAFLNDTAWGCRQVATLTRHGDKFAMCITECKETGDYAGNSYAPRSPLDVSAELAEVLDTILDPLD